MSTVTDLDIGPVKFVTTQGQNSLTSLAAIQAKGSLHRLTLEDITDISEWLAVAWENIAGEVYSHKSVGIETVELSPESIRFLGEALTTQFKLGSDCE